MDATFSAKKDVILRRLKMTEEEVRKQFDLQYHSPLVLPQEMPWYFKTCLSLTEAALYTGIGQTALRRLASEHREIVLFNGAKMLFKRRKLEELLMKEFSI